MDVERPLGVTLTDLFESLIFVAAVVEVEDTGGGLDGRGDVLGDGVDQWAAA